MYCIHAVGYFTNERIYIICEKNNVLQGGNPLQNLRIYTIQAIIYTVEGDIQ